MRAIAEWYRGNAAKIFPLLVLTLIGYYAWMIRGGAGGDLMFRLSEARYFVNGINPYDVSNWTVKGG